MLLMTNMPIKDPQYVASSRCIFCNVSVYIHESGESEIPEPDQFSKPVNYLELAETAKASPRAALDDESIDPAFAAKALELCTGCDYRNSRIAELLETSQARKGARLTNDFD